MMKLLYGGQDGFFESPSWVAPRLHKHEIKRRRRGIIMAILCACKRPFTIDEKCRKCSCHNDQMSEIHQLMRIGLMMSKPTVASTQQVSIVALPHVVIKRVLVNVYYSSQTK